MENGIILKEKKEVKMELITVNENNELQLNTETSKAIAKFEKQIKKLKEQEDALKEQILKEMQEKNIIKIDTQDLVINYIEETTRETFDSKSFKKDHQDLYDEYVKMSKVNPCIKIKVK